MSNKALGRGLDALFNPVSQDSAIQEASVSDLRANPYQPRKHFDEAALNELVDSIRRHGIVQPIVVRKSIRGYEIAAGERRFRAAKLAGLDAVPVVVQEYNDEQMMEIALIENLQRENLNPMEVAEAYQKLMFKLSITQEELAEKVGKSRPHVTNFLRLLQLPSEVQNHVSRGTLSMGHARSLIGIKDREQQKRLLRKTLAEKASVRQLEEWIQNLNKSKVKAKEKVFREKTPVLRHYESVLQEVYSTPVRIQQGPKKGCIEIEFYSQRELERIMERMNQGRVIT